MTLHKARHSYRTLLTTLFLFGGAATAGAQNTPEMREVLNRLERLEKDNETLTEELRALRTELAGLHTPAPEAASAATPAPIGQIPATESSPPPAEAQA